MSVDVMITGGAGMLAQALHRVFTQNGRQVALLSKAELDVTDERSVHDTVSRLRPRIIIQCAAYTQVDRAEEEEQTAHRVNAAATEYMADAANEFGARLIYPSTDYVFDGRGSTPYRPDHPTNPINAYGRSKVAGEIAARSARESMVVRTSWLYGRGGRNFVRAIADRARRGGALRVVNDQHGSPTSAADAAQTIYDLDAKGAVGTYHVTNSGHTTWYGFACAVLYDIGLSPAIEPVPSVQYPTPAARPHYSVLDCSATVALTAPLADWKVALHRAIMAADY